MDMNGTQETFLLHFQAIGEPPNDGDEDTRPTFMILGTNYFFYSLCTSDTGYGDGTFQKCAPPFKQLFTMHFISFPALYIFLNGKSASLYEHALQWIIDYAASARPTPLQIKWTNFMSDFESGFVPAFKAVFLWVYLHGCFFHWCQAIYRKVVEIGLNRLYMDETSNFRNFVRMLMSLAYLPANEVEAGLLDIWNNANLNITDPIEQGLFNRFIQYFLNEWMTKIEEWNINQLLYGTNNFVEGWHTHINSEWSRTRNLWATILSIHFEHKYTAIDYESVLAKQLRREWSL